MTIKYLNSLAFTLILAFFVPGCGNILLIGGAVFVAQEKADNTGDNKAPLVSIMTPVGIRVGTIQLYYTLKDDDGDDCSITAEFSLDLGVSWVAATMGAGGDGSGNLNSSTTGVQHMYAWNSWADNVGLTVQDNLVQFRITPNDSRCGTSAETDFFSVNNTGVNLPPCVDIIGGPDNGSTIDYRQVTFVWTGSDPGGAIAGYYYLFDTDPSAIWTTGTFVTSGEFFNGLHVFQIQAEDNSGLFGVIVERYFTVSIPMPGQAFNPDPPDGETDVSTPPLLSWSSASNADSYDVYLGSNYVSIIAADNTSAEFMGSQPGLSCIPPANFESEETYYWRVDGINITGTTNGRIWSFTTGIAQMSDNMTWTLKNPTDSPGARWMIKMAWDGTQIVLFGGSRFRPMINLLLVDPETWAWDGDDWTELSPADQPYSRYGSGMCYDGRGAFMFGGQAIATPGPPYTYPCMNDTWRFITGNWVELNPVNQPPPRVCMSMAWDSTRDVIVMFGGLDNNSVVCCDTWEFDLPTCQWYEVTVASPPDNRQSAACCYLDDATIIYSGSPDRWGGGTHNDMFTWTYPDWIEFLPATPGPLEMAAMAVDTDKGYAILYGGSNGSAFDNTSAYSDRGWLFNGSEWKPIAASGPDAPGTLVGASMAYDPVNREFVLFGGFGGGDWNSGFKDETWTLKE